MANKLSYSFEKTFNSFRNCTEDIQSMIDANSKGLTKKELKYAILLVEEARRLVEIIDEYPCRDDEGCEVNDTIK